MYYCDIDYIDKDPPFFQFPCFFSPIFYFFFMIFLLFCISYFIWFSTFSNFYLIPISYIFQFPTFSDFLLITNSSLGTGAPMLPAASSNLCSLFSRNCQSPVLAHWPYQAESQHWGDIQHYTLYTVHCTLYTTHYTLYTIYYTLYTTLYTVRQRFGTSPFGMSWDRK